MREHMLPVDANKAYRLFNLGGTALVSAAFDGVEGIMPATWICPLDLCPTKATAVIDKSHFTRPLIEKSGYFALMLPTAAIVNETMKLGTVSKFDEPQKIEKSGAKLFHMEGFGLPLVEGCAAWAIFRVIPDANDEQHFDLFKGECVAAWADDRVFSEGHWHLEKAPASMRLLHYVAGGHWYVTGDPLVLPEYNDD